MKLSCMTKPEDWGYNW